MAGQNLSEISQVLPWGRSFDEYRAMFDLDGRAFPRAGAAPRVLDVGGGPASFTAEAVARGWQALACDPLYALDGAAIENRVEAARDQIMALVRAERQRFVWTSIESPEALERLRLAAMARFLEDYEAGRAAGRYRAEALPTLDWPDAVFDLALASHLLFLYSAQWDVAFHLAAIRELARVAAEVRIFPLLDMTGRPSAHLAAVLAGLRAEGFAADIRKVPYEFQRGGDEMLVVTPPRPEAVVRPG